MNKNIDTIIRHTKQYWYVDGLAEITVGLFFMALSGYFLIQKRIQSTHINPVLANLGLLTFLVLVAWLFRYALQAAKAHLTYPRTGYVAYPGNQKASRWERYGLLAWLTLVCIALVTFASRTHTIPVWAPLLEGGIAGLTALAVSYRFHLLRFAYLAFVLGLIGAAVSFLNPGEPLTTILPSIAGGACFMISGGTTLIHYLRSTQPPVEKNL